MRSLTSRTIVWVFLPILTCSAIDLFVAFRSTDRVATLIQQQLLTASARIIAEQFADPNREDKAPQAAFDLLADEYKDHVFFAVRTQHGELLEGDSDLAPLPRSDTREKEAFFNANVHGEPVRVVSYLQSLDADAVLTVEVAQSLHGRAALRDKLFMITAREHLVLLLLVLAALVTAVRWTLRPLLRFSEYLAQRRSGSLEPLGTDSLPRELLPVIASLNGYVAKLDEEVTSHERFVATTAHHLRTSFAILTSQLNYGMRDERLSAEHKALFTAMRTTTVRGATVIRQLLTLASIEQSRQEAARHESRGHTLIAEIVASVVEELAPLARRHAVELGVDEIDPELKVPAQPHLLREIVFNLVDNAIKHMNGPGSVSVKAQRDENRGILRVTDTGPGIAIEHRERVFERFYRADPEKSNSFGLGLAIVKEICDSLQGKIELSVPASGSGLQVDISLPLQD